MPNLFPIQVDGSAELLNAGAYGTGAIIRVQSSATETGTFANLAGTGSTPTIALVAGTRLYTAYDSAGAQATWYRWRIESADAARLSDWSAVFQVGSKEAGLICSLDDVTNRLSGTPSGNDRELLLEFIRHVGREIEGYCGRLFVRDPLSGTETLTFDAWIGRTIARDRRTFWFPQGLATVTQLRIKDGTDGTFAIVPVSDWFLRPVAEARDIGWPATRIELTDRPSSTNTRSTFHEGFGAIEITGARGFDTVPPDVAGIAENAVIRRFIAKGSGTATALGTDEFAVRTLRWISPEERQMLDFYRVRRLA